MRKIQSVLLVDDMEIEHVNIQYVLEDFDESIVLHSAYDGQEALDLLCTLQTSPDVIFLDINMPRMNGHEFLKAYKHGGGKAPIIVMLTSSIQEEDKNKCDAYEFVKMYVSKPLEEFHLVEIQKIIN